MTKTDALIMKSVIFLYRITTGWPLCKEENAPFFQDPKIASDKRKSLKQNNWEVVKS